MKDDHVKITSEDGGVGDDDKFPIKVTIHLPHFAPPSPLLYWCLLLIDIAETPRLMEDPLIQIALVCLTALCKF